MPNNLEPRDRPKFAADIYTANCVADTRLAQMLMAIINDEHALIVPGNADGEINEVVLWQPGFAFEIEAVDAEIAAKPESVINLIKSG